eukprot:7567913-Pyramimonas_sp.AAC.1
MPWSRWMKMYVLFRQSERRSSCPRSTWPTHTGRLVAVALVDGVDTALNVLVAPALLAPVVALAHRAQGRPNATRQVAARGALAQGFRRAPGEV